MPNSSKNNSVSASTGNWRYWLQIFFALAGMGLSLYLLVQHTRLKNGIQDGPSFCTFGTWANCEAVNNSDYSEVAGIPLATIGYLFFSALLVLCLVARPGKRGFAQAQRWATWLVALGILADAVLLLVQLTQIHSICLVCTTTYLCNLGFFAMAVGLSGKGAKGMAEKIKAAFRKRSETSALPASSLAFGTFGWLVLALAIFIVPGTIVSKTTATNPTDGSLNEAQKLAEVWDKMPTQDLPVKNGDGTFGNPMAKIRIVEFSDFECPFCQRAAGIIHRALEPMKDRVYFAFKNFPLDSSCNPKLQYPMHPNACKLAALAYCAKEKGKFWDYHDGVFGLDEKALAGDINALQKPLAKIFSAGEFKACLASESAKKNVKEDIDLGIKLDIHATPSVFINGKKMFLPVTEENLQLLVAREENRLNGVTPVPGK